ncbi:hypothetical protein [Allokutzneria oryzae]|uniref:Uncharacterized protein n=1 Tax=Allokutzneria oryzae TaxID=1378989 RepID=A0ABV5ZYJ0_9PSEU
MTESARPETIAVVVPDSLGGGDPTACEATRGIVAVIEDIAGLSARVVPFPLGYLHHLHTSGEDALAGAGAVVVANARPEHARTVRDLVDVPVLTDQDTTAIALTARVLTALVQHGRAPQAGRVVVAGADTLPVLFPVLLAAGVGDITAWNQEDAVSFPLRRIAVGADVVIDLLGTCSGTENAAMPPEAVVITPEDGRDALVALPGLLRALARVPGARLDVAVRHACALALVMATPPEEQLPQEPDNALADQVAAAAAGAFSQPAHRPHPTSTDHLAE